MPTLFPGMDPYLEQPGIWEQVHTRLIVAIADVLVPKVSPKYRVDIELRVYSQAEFSQGKDDLVGIPDAVITEKQVREVASAYATEPAIITAELPEVYEVRERYLEIRTVKGGDTIAVIEVLSPANKRPGRGREDYAKKRLEILGTRTNLIEIDLIRAGERLPMTIREGKLLDYHILVSRTWQYPLADVYAFSLHHPIPDFPVPLQRDESEPTVPLNQLLHDLYDHAGYAGSIDYRRPLHPSLSPEDAAWVQSILQLNRNPVS